MRFAFYSCMAGMPWGGSEELWYLTAKELLAEGHEVVVNYPYWPQPADPLVELRELGAEIHFRNLAEKKSTWSWASGLSRLNPRNTRAGEWIARRQPDLLLVTAGYHPDSIPFVGLCRKRMIPMAINVQCASNSAFINEHRLAAFRDAYRSAQRVYFVSDENRQKMETNLASELKNTEIICNPYNISPNKEPTWPADRSTIRLACVGRIHFVSKGQDLIVQVLRQPKWRDRNLKIVIYGRDQGNERQLRDLVKLYQLENKFEFAGYSQDLNQLWNDNHALILPSRYEGAPLVLVEAMMAHRIAITTDIGRNRELIDDNETGFIAAAPTIDLLDDAMERAWSQRDKWRSLGLRAGQAIRQRFSLDPVSDFKSRLLSLAQNWRQIDSATAS